MNVSWLPAWSLLSCLLLPSIVHSGTGDKPRWQTRSLPGNLQVVVYPQQGQYVIGDFHKWIISVHKPNGEAINNAAINLTGGMPSHGHGLPSQPLVTRYLGNGEYLVEGMLFNMPGEWLLNAQIGMPKTLERASFMIDVNY